MTPTEEGGVTTEALGIEAEAGIEAGSGCHGNQDTEVGEGGGGEGKNQRLLQQILKVH